VPLQYKIIVVEDNPHDQEAISIAFEKIGYDEPVLFLNTGKKLINRLDDLEFSQYPSLVVLDYNMSGLNGMETLQQIKSNPSTANIPVVIYSTAFLATDIRQMEKLGALVCMNKAEHFETVVEQAKFFTELIKAS
jgi:CheY-like chemotaxis protein